jgi:signal transduction histidine kinase
VKFGIEESLERLNPLVSPDTLRSLEAAVALIQEVMRELRAMLKSLRPAMLDDLGILATVAWLCREIESIYSGITVERHTDLDEDEIPGRLKIAMFRIIQEGLNNAVKHSQCDRIQLELRQNGELIELEVRDNGKGFPPNLWTGDPESETGMGLSSMRERAELSGGRFTIDSSPEAGTRILVSWPREG